MFTTGKSLIRAFTQALGSQASDTQEARLPYLKQDKVAFDFGSAVKIPVNTTSLRDNDDDAIRQEALALARQDRWDLLAERITDADRARATTASGASVAELLMFGARADVVLAAEHALLHGELASGADFSAGVNDLEYVLFEYPNTYALALVVAHMHIDIGWAWRGHGSQSAQSEQNHMEFARHFARAEEILDAFCAHSHDSAALSAARCALLPAQSQPSDRIADDFEDLIDLDPKNPRHFRALGTYLLPQWYGDYAKLDLEARRSTARTQDIWGAGAYTWVWFDAMVTDPRAMSHMDAAFFVDGLCDILDRIPDQNTANLMAAQLFCACQAAEGHPELHKLLFEGFEQVVKHNLREIHPLIWGHAEIGFDNRSRRVSLDRLAKQGTDMALNALAQPFRRIIEAGSTVHFGPTGITELHP